MTPRHRIRFSAGFFFFSLLWMTALGIVASVLLPQRLAEIAPDSKEAVFGVLNAATAVVSLISNLIVGNLSDRTRSVFGRRAPWILSGGVLAGITLFLIGVLPNAFLIGVSYCLAMVGLNMMIAPVMASLADRVSESMRGTMSAFISAGTLVGQSVGTLIGAVFITSVLPGFVISGVVMAISGLAAVILWPREKSAQDLPVLEKDFASILRSFRPPRNAPDFYRAFAGRSLVILSYYMILNYQLYILQDYIGLSTENSAATIGTMSILLMIVSFVAALTAGPISDRLGRRKLPVVGASILLAIGYALPWIFPSVLSMILFAAIGGGLGYGMYGSVDQALNVDVLPKDENAGRNLGFLNIGTTLGQMAGPILTSVIVSVTQSYQLVFPTAIVLVVVGCLFILHIKSVR
ncbi:MFS transporter [Cryobacterium sp. MDB2-10]|uniref:MFS transporter n=1 Tax=Cryobacterium sp. MDB2-10 TaxID=1259177 RepID=UPI0010734760|nr:MFS transporter [Cryobacterium sp. MDB2-10]TFC17473.1 MFS transporter [Cryobacterium sp. MDB2-10]